jgi:hypothetical protein
VLVSAAIILAALFSFFQAVHAADAAASAYLDAKTQYAREYAAGQLSLLAETGNDDYELAKGAAISAIEYYCKRIPLSEGEVVLFDKTPASPSFENDYIFQK